MFLHLNRCCACLEYCMVPRDNHRLWIGLSLCWLGHFIGPCIRDDWWHMAQHTPRASSTSYMSKKIRFPLQFHKELGLWDQWPWSQCLNPKWSQKLCSNDGPPLLLIERCHQPPNRSAASWRCELIMDLIINFYFWKKKELW